MLSKVYLKFVCLICLLTLIVACKDGSSSSNQVINVPPIANAGVDQVVDELTLVILKGEGEAFEGTITNYSWTQERGIPVQIEVIGQGYAHFLSPNTTGLETLTFTLNITDNTGSISSSSVNIEVNNINTFPIARVELDKNIQKDTIISLKGEGVDPDGDIVDYYWEQTAGTPIELLDFNSATAKFTTPNANKIETLTFLFTVTDNEGATDSKSININIEPLKDELSDHFYRMLSYHKRIDPNLPDNSIIIIGDSHIQGLAVSAISPNSVNYGIGSDTTLGVINRLGSYHSLAKAKTVILAIGNNDLSRRENSKILDNFKTILDIIPTEINVLVSAIFPVGQRDNSINHNSRVIEINSSLYQLISEYHNVYFLDINDSLIDDNGNLDKKYHIGDAVHLNSEGYSIWIDALKLQLM